MVDTESRWKTLTRLGSCERQDQLANSHYRSHGNELKADDLPQYKRDRQLMTPLS